MTDATIWEMTKAELHAQIESMTDEEAAEEIRKRTGTQAMSPEQSEKSWREHGPLMQPADGEGYSSILDGIPGAWERAHESIEQARRGETFPLSEL